jgi:hypothetical protein
MELLFNSTDIENWARFSGDRNPIHFDIKAAERLGVSKIIVHGMLVLLEVKHQVAIDERSNGNDWIQFRALLKKPILKDETAFMQVKDKGKKQRFSVSSNDASNYVMGFFWSVPSEIWDSAEETYTLAPRKVNDNYEYFYRTFNKQYSTWIWLDGLIFGHFISHKINELISRLQISNIKEINSLEEIFGYTVVQTSHQTTFCKSIRLLKVTPDTDVSYQMDNLSIQSADGSMFGTLDLRVMINGQHLMTIELGLLLKINLEN